MPVDLQNRLSSLVDLDVALVLARVVADIRQEIDSQETDSSAFLLDAWEEALGTEIDSVARALRAVRGFRGYQAAAARFSLKEKWRQEGIDHLHNAMRRRSQVAFGRWIWIARAYRDALEDFIDEQQCILDNKSQLLEIEMHRAEHRQARFRILRLIMGAHRSILTLPETFRPGLQRHAINRLKQTAAHITRFDTQLRSRIAERDMWRVRAESVLGERLPRQQIAGLSSPAVQTATYQRLLAEDQLMKASVCKVASVRAVAEQTAKLSLHL